MTNSDEEGDKHRWCRGIVGLEHRAFDPSDFSERRYCAKCGVEEADYLRALGSMYPIVSTMCAKGLEVDVDAAVRALGAMLTSEPDTPTAAKPVYPVTLHTAAILHAGWEMDNEGWIMETADGKRIARTTGHGRECEWTRAEAIAKLEETERSAASIRKALQMWPEDEA